MPALEATLCCDENRVTQQFCAALLFEGIVQPGEPDEEGWQEWVAGGCRFRARASAGAFGRRTLSEGPERKTSSGWTSAGWQDLLAALDLTCGVRDRVHREFSRTAINWQSAKACLSQVRRHRLTGAELESAIIEGHPYHPSFKARTGFSDADNRAFGPEAASPFQLEWVLLARDLVESTPGGRLDDPGNSQTCSLGPGLEKEGFVPFPVHPWQMRQLYRDATFSDWIAAGRAVCLGPLGDRYRATQSVRTLMNVDRPAGDHVKLSLAIGNTSSLRTLDPDCVLIASTISNWLEEVVAADSFLADTSGLTILREHSGAIAGRGSSLAPGSLAMIRRVSPDAVGIAPDAILPFNALPLMERDGRPLIDPWVARFGLMNWFERLVDVAVLPVWHLMLAHGIGIEAHAQNLLLRHENGWPTGLVARDFHESLEYVPELLPRPGLAPDLGALDPAFRSAERGRFHAMAGPEDLRELVMDTLFIYNLADLTACLERAYGLSEKVAWARIRKRLDAHVHRYGLEERAALFCADAPRIATESLVSRTLFPGRDSYHHLVPNALAR
ncbi:IucA/IucC family protein [Amaricoccus macauensis]|uniref:IucA/IucC family protein n=1 Tax=Amaricoccus macauensis TaxID=57001 RepID=UPI003C7C0726